MNKPLLTGIVLFLVGVVRSQEPFTLADAKIYALQHNISVQNAAHDIEIAQQKVIEIRGMGLPQVDLDGRFSNFINLPVQVVDASFINPTATPGSTVEFRAGTDYSVTGTLQVSQLVFNGSYIIGLQAANYFTNFQKTVSDISKEDVLFNVIQTYQLSSVALENKLFADSLVMITEELIGKQRNYLELGLMKEEDFEQLAYSLLTAKNAQIAANLQYENTLNALKLSMGYPVENQITITESPSELLLQNTLSTGNYRSNLSYMLLEKQIQLSELDVKNHQFTNLPSVNAFFQHSYNAYRNTFNFYADEKWYPQTVWGLQLNVPVFSGLSRQAKTAQAKVKLLKDQNSLAQMEQTLQFQEQQAKNNYTHAQSRHNLQKENIRMAKSLYDKALIREEIGETNSILVTQRYNQLIVAHTQYIGSLVDVFNAKLNLDKIYNKILPLE